MTLRALFNRPAERDIGSVQFLVFKVAYERFDDAITLGKWLTSVDFDNFSIDMLAEIRSGTPEREALDRTVASCLSVVDGAARDPSDESPRLAPADVAAMPIVMLGEAIVVVMEINADFFFHSLKRVAPIVSRLGMWTGLAFPSNLSGPGTTPTPSDATPSASSAVS